MGHREECFSEEPVLLSVVMGTTKLQRELPLHSLLE